MVQNIRYIKPWSWFSHYSLDNDFWDKRSEALYLFRLLARVKGNMLWILCIVRLLCCIEMTECLTEYTAQWTVNPWNALEDRERRLSLGLDWCLVCPLLLNTNIMIIITTLWWCEGGLHSPDLFILYELLTLIVWCHVFCRVIGHVSHVYQEDGHQSTRDTCHSCYSHRFQCSEIVQKFRAWEIHTMKSRDSQSANECLEQLMSYSFR